MHPQMSNPPGLAPRALLPRIGMVLVLSRLRGHRALGSGERTWGTRQGQRHGREHIHRKAGSWHRCYVQVPCAHLALLGVRHVCLIHLSSTYPWRSGQVQAFPCPTLRDSWEPGVKRGRDWPRTKDGYRVQGPELPSSPRQARPSHEVCLEGESSSFP